jgi:2-C-methyl-D-erythritol 4-phosphate cytidylyltransferase
VPDRDDDVAVASLALVPVDADEPTAPLSCPAFRELRGRPLLSWAVSALTASGVVRHVVVAVPAVLEGATRDVVAAVPRGAIDVLVEVQPTPADGQGHPVIAALRGTEMESRGDIVVVHDPLHPLSTAALVRAVVHELDVTPDGAAAVPARPVTDTLKWVDGDEVVLDTADRKGYRLIGSPQAYREAALLAALDLAGAADLDLRERGPEVLPRLVAARGGRIVMVPFPREAFRVLTEDDLALADALLAAEVDLCRRIGVTSVE